VIPVTQTIPYEAGSVVNGNCLQAAVASIYELPIEAVPHFLQFGEQWGEALQMYVRSTGHELLKLGDEPTGGEVVMAFGRSPRGVGHAVVWQDGAIVHDPHPSRDGLVGFPAEFWSITRERTDA
jgi:hypothetical protein